jgi:hypothetical protein
MHRARKQIHGSYDDPKPTELERFHAGYEIAESGCWEWRGYLNDHGYGQIGVDGVSVYAHRWSYEHFIGPIPAGKQIDHLCRNRKCCNPAHLEAVTPLVNNRRGESPWSVNARKTHCIRGHEFTQANTYVNKHGWRSCRQCMRISAAKAYARRKALRAA